MKVWLLGAGCSHNRDQLTSGRSDLMLASGLQRDGVHQFAPCSDCESASREKFTRISGVYSAGRNQFSIWKGTAHGFDVFRAADASARKNLDGGSARLQRRNQFRGSERARKGQLFFLMRHTQNGKTQSWTNQKPRPGSETLHGLLRIGDRAGADQNALAELRTNFSN